MKYLSFVIFLLILRTSHAQNPIGDLRLNINNPENITINKFDLGPVLNFSFNKAENSYNVQYMVSEQIAFLLFKPSSNGNYILLGDEKDLLFKAIEENSRVVFISEFKDGLQYIFEIVWNTNRME